MKFAALSLTRAKIHDHDLAIGELIEHPAPPLASENTVVAQYDGQEADLVVDQLPDEFQRAIKQQNTFLRPARDVAGEIIRGR